MTAKEILDKLKGSVDNPIIDVPTCDGSDSEPMDNIALLKPNACKQLLDYITNLQQDLDEANDIIEKDRQFYKCRMDEYVDLKKENERLKETIENLTTMTVCGDKKQIKNTAQYKLDIYKSRCEKAIEYINKHTYNPSQTINDERLEVNPKYLLNILNGSDENETNS